MIPNSLAFTRRELKASTTIVKRKQERGSPCQIPFEAVNNLEGEPLTRTEKEVVEMDLICRVCNSTCKRIHQLQNKQTDNEKGPSEITYPLKQKGIRNLCL